jgi:hypothetical protein
VTELFKTAGLDEVENKKKKILNTITLVDKTGEAFLKNLFSISMMKVYATAIFVFLGLKYIL